MSERGVMNMLNPTLFSLPGVCSVELDLFLFLSRD